MEENKMGVMPIGKLIVTMSLPIMISMLVQALYNVVDSVFVARIDDCSVHGISNSKSDDCSQCRNGSGCQCTTGSLSWGERL